MGGPVPVRDRWLALSAVALVAPLVVASLGLGAGGTAQAESAGATGDCRYADVHNTAKVAATPVGTVVAGQELNGTGGAVWFTGLASNDPYGIRWVRLVGPNGTNIGPVKQIGPNVIIDGIPLCHEGTWRLKEHPSNVTLTRFRTTTDSQAPAPDTIVLDRPVHRTPSPVFDAGEAYAADAFTLCRWDDGETWVGRGIGAQRTNVSLNWTVEAPGSFEGLITLEASGQHGTYMTTVRAEDWGNGTVSVYPEWRSPGVQEVALTAWSVKDGVFWSRCTETRQISIGPGFEALPIPWD